jgi:effector-binding domain-containing protein
MELIAAVRGRANEQNVGERIRELFDQLYAFVANAGMQTGHNVVIYNNLADRNLFRTAEGVPLEVGVHVSAPFPARENVICSATPEGGVATCLHIGRYDRLSETHRAIQMWARANGYTFAGPCWEVYGDWCDDSTQLRTEVFYLLK